MHSHRTLHSIGLLLCFPTPNTQENPPSPSSKRMTHWDTGKTTHERYHSAKGIQLNCSSLSQLAVSRMGKSTDAPELYYTLLILFQALKVKANTLNYMRNARQAWNWSDTSSLERNVSQTRNNTVRSTFTHNPCRQKINTLRFIPWVLDLGELMGNTVVSQIQNSNCFFISREGIFFVY